MAVYRLDKNNVIDDEGEDYGSVIEFLESEYDLVEDLNMLLLTYTDVYHTSSDKKDLIKKIKEFLNDHFVKFFKNKEKVSYSTMDREVKTLIRSVKKHSESTENLIRNHISSFFKKKTGGVDMFKNLKEAKMFTAHLDALASEIEGLEGVSPDMRKHLAYRLDKLSDVIEQAASNKEASVEKEAVGVGRGALEHDADEAYMKTFGGTGALQREADEPYMDLFLGADNAEVMRRQEPADVRKASEEETFKSYVKKALEKIK